MGNRHLFSLCTVVLTAVVLAGIFPVSAATYYVSTAGNDTTGDGSVGNPWKTITHAAATVPAGTMGSPNEIVAAAGVYDAANGESFPIALNNDYVSLLGATSGTTRIQGVGTEDPLLEIDNNAGINAITIQDITLAGAVTGIKSFNGGITLISNTFEASITEGFHLGIDTTSTPLSASMSVPRVTLTGNTFNCSGAGAYIYVELRFDNTTAGLTANLGGIVASSNTFNTAAGNTGLDVDAYTVTYMQSGTITVGPISVTGNTFNGGARGFDFYGDFFVMTDTSLAAGIFNVSNNNCTDQTNSAININYYDLDYWYGTGSAILGTLSINNNSINSAAVSSYGIYVDDLGYLYELYDSVSVTTGAITISNNSVTTRHGIYLNYTSIENFGTGGGGDTVSVNYGGSTISGNTVTSSGSYGIYINLSYIGDFMNAQTGITFGGITVANNTIASPSEGLTFYFENVGYDMYDNAQLTMNPFVVSNNTVTSGGDAVYIEYYDYYVASYMNGDAIATLPDWSLTGNTFDSTGGRGIYFHTYSNPDDNYNNADARFGSMLIDSNTFNPNMDAGMDIGVDLFIDDFCEDCYDSTTTTIGDITVTNNTIFNTTNDGINVWYGEVAYNFDADAQVTMGNSDFSGNTINGGTYGIYLEIDDAWTGYSSTVSIGEIDFLDNTISNVTATGIYFDLDATNSDPGTATLNIKEPRIKGNSITADPGGAQNGIYVFGDIDTGVDFGTPEIADNTISGFSSGILVEGGITYNGLAGATITGNTVGGNSIGLQFTSAGTNFAVSCNSFVNNSKWGLAVDNGHAANVKAEFNWWGDAAGPAACPACNKIDPGDLGIVTYTPWLMTTPDKASQCSDFYWPMFLPAIIGAR